MSEGGAGGFLRGLASFANIIGIIAIPIVVALIGGKINTSISQSDVRLRMIELATEVLSMPVNPTEGQTGAENDDDALALRRWAIDVINTYSEVKLSEEAREALETTPLVLSEADRNTPALSAGPYPMSVSSSGSIRLPVQLHTQDERPIANARISIGASTGVFLDTELERSTQWTNENGEVVFEWRFVDEAQYQAAKEAGEVEFSIVGDALGQTPRLEVTIDVE